MFEYFDIAFNVIYFTISIIVLVYLIFAKNIAIHCVIIFIYNSNNNNICIMYIHIILLLLTSSAKLQ